MANWCENKVFITHKNTTKVSDLYRISAGDFFTFLLPPPVELCNKDKLLDKQYSLEEFGADNLRDWINQNWMTSSSPFPDYTRTISKKYEYMTLEFETPWRPPIGIYAELEKRGYRVRAYFWEPGEAICGSFIYGKLEYIEYLPEFDIPFDIDMIFDIKSYHLGYLCGDECNDQDANYDEYIVSIIDEFSEKSKIDYFQPIANYIVL